MTAPRDASFTHSYAAVGGGPHTFAVHPAAMAHHDRWIIREMPVYRTLALRGETVLDIGGHIGAFAVMALQLGARRVVSVEPEPSNAALYRRNLEAFGPTARLVEAAAAPNARYRRLSLYVSPGTSSWNAHRRLSRRHRHIRVPAIPMDRVYGLAAFTAMKVDCEGAEYNLFLGGPPIPYGITDVLMELHLRTRGDRESAGRLIETMESRWRCVRRPVITGRRTTTYAQWTRRRW